jgi:hypothetical protein
MIHRGKLGRVVVGFLAGRDTGLAADTKCGVIKQPECFGRPWAGFPGERRYSRGARRGRHPAREDTLEKISPGVHD